jgi:hypothetical protein
VLATEIGLPELERRFGRPVPVATEVRTDAPRPARSSTQAARSERRRLERERRAALGCTCPGGHRRACPLFGEQSAPASTPGDTGGEGASS